jgi:hypothetical protein
MNRFQKALSAMPREAEATVQAMVSALSEVGGAAPDNWIEAHEALRGFVEPSVRALLALRDVGYEGDEPVGAEDECAFNREVFVFQMLSEDDPDDYSLEEVAHRTSEGGSVGNFVHSFNDRLEPGAMAAALWGAGSDSDFFFG